MVYPTPGSRIKNDDEHGSNSSSSNISISNSATNKVADRKKDNATTGITDTVRGITPELELVNLANGIDVNIPCIVDRERILKARELLNSAINLELMSACLLAGIDIPDKLQHGGLIKHTYLVDGDKKTVHLTVLANCVEALNKVINTNDCGVLLRGLRKYYPEVNAVQAMSLGEMVTLADEYIGKRFTGELQDLSPEEDIINRIFKCEIENEIWTLSLTPSIEPIPFKVVDLDYFNDIGLLCIYVDSLASAHGINTRINENKFIEIVRGYIPQLNAISISYERLHIIM